MLDAIFRLFFNYRPVVFQQGEFRLLPTTGSLAFLGLAFAANPAGPPCGTPLAGYGMAGGGSPGELLISLGDIKQVR